MMAFTSAAVAARVHSTKTIDSYVSTFVSLTLVMGVVFQLPVMAFFLGKMGLVTSDVLSMYRRHAFLVIKISFFHYLICIIQIK